MPCCIRCDRQRSAARQGVSCFNITCKRSRTQRSFFAPPGIGPLSAARALTAPCWSYCRRAGKTEAYELGAWSLGWTPKLGVAGAAAAAAAAVASSRSGGGGSGSGGNWRQQPPATEPKHVRAAPHPPATRHRTLALPNLHRTRKEHNGALPPPRCVWQTRARAARRVRAPSAATRGCSCAGNGSLQGRQAGQLEHRPVHLMPPQLS